MKHNDHRGRSIPVIAILDSGADLAHPDLAMNIWINQGELPKAMQTGGTPGAGRTSTAMASSPFETSICRGTRPSWRNSTSPRTPAIRETIPTSSTPTASWSRCPTSLTTTNSYVDDIVGINTSAALELARASPERRRAAHGRYTSGAAAATENNGLGVPGVAPFARLMFVTSCSTLANGCELSLVEQAMDYAAMEKADIVNRSQGALYYKSDGLNLAFGNAPDGGVLSGSSEVNCVSPPGAWLRCPTGVAGQLPEHSD